MVEWLEKRNDKMEWVNLDALTKLENHAQSGTKDVRDDTGLSIKARDVCAESGGKVQIVDEVFSKKLESSCGTGLDGVSIPTNMTKRRSLTVQQLSASTYFHQRCPWYY